MIHNKLLIYISFIFFISINVQSTFAVESENEQKSFLTSSFTSFYNLVTAMAKVSIEEKCVTPYFPPLPDEMTMNIFVFLFGIPEDVRNLSAVALTCTHGYQLMQDSAFGSLLKPFLRSIGFRHLPQEYLDVLLQDIPETGLKLGDILLQQLFVYQKEEVKRLSELLDRDSSASGSVDQSILVNKISRETKNIWLDKLETLKKTDLWCSEPDDEEPVFEDETVKMIRSSSCQRYWFQEGVLDLINSQIIAECFNFFQTRGNTAQIRLQGSITRLPRNGVTFIHNWLMVNNHHIEYAVFDLAYNNLRWIPDELFTFPKILVLCLNNNLLCYLPSRIEFLKNHLITLEVGNFGSYSPLYPNYHSRRTLGNTFRKTPLIIHELHKLESLDLCNVQLEEFPHDTLYQNLTSLEHVNVANNNLAKVPVKGHKNIDGRTISVDSYGNPGSPSIPFYQRIGDYCYNFYSLMKGLPMG